MDMKETLEKSSLIDKMINDAQVVVQKGITTGDLNGASGSATATTRQDLDATILSIADRNTPLRDLIVREQGQGAAFTFNLRESLFKSGENANPREAYYGDGGLAEEKSTAYFTQTVAFKALGYTGSVTGLAKAQAKSLVDLLAAEIEATTRRVIQAEEWLMFWSDTTIANTNGLFGFPGLDELITTNVIDALGQPISKILVDRVTELIAQRGGMATHIFTSIRTGINLNNLFNSFAQVIINQSERDNLTLGNKVRDISTVAGTLSIVPDFFLNPGNTYPNSDGSSSAPSGAATSSAFILAMPHLSMRDLQAIGMEELGRVADKTSFYVNEYTALKLKAEPWCGKIINLDDTIQP